MISYAQNFEDVMLWRALKNIHNGFYVDVGAWSPDLDSVTRHFYEQGWIGINIEPNPVFYNEYVTNRKKDINLNVAVSDSIGETEIYFSTNPGLSSLDKEIAEGHKSIGFDVKPAVTDVTTLEQICRDYAKSKDIHFLKVDVEGLEDKVLAGNDWSDFRPWIVLVEATLPMSQIENYEQWEHILLSADYQFVYADGLNRFYVSKEHSELVQSFKYPPNVFDDFILASQVQAEAKASEAEAKASEAEAKASEAEAKANEAEQSKSQWQLLVAQNQQSLIEFQLISTKLEQKAQELQEVIVSEQQKAERLNEVLAETEAKLTLAEAEIDSLRHHSHHWWVEAEEKSKQLNLLNETTNSLKEKIVELNASSHHWWQTADSLSKELEQFRSLYESVVNSHSWRITYPLRLLGKFTRWLVYGSYHWLTFSPNSRPRRLLKQWLISAKQKINQKPTLKKRLIRILSVFPRLKARLKRVGYVGLPNSALISSHIESSSVPTTQQAYLDLSQRAKKIYAQLKQAIEN